MLKVIVIDTEQCVHREIMLATDGEMESVVIQIRKILGRQHSQAALLLGEDCDKSSYIAGALSYITKHYGDKDICIDRIAEEVGISEGHLSHLFRKEMECTVNEYITRCRMQAAMRLLSDCRYKVYEVADLVGYRDVPYFTTIFKRQVGISPSEYQNRCG